MLDGFWDQVEHRMVPVRHPTTVAIQRTMAWCSWATPHADLRFLCSGCLDRVMLEDY